jgi:hypothetical protein
MKIILYLSDSVPRVSSEAHVEVQSGANILKESPQVQCVLLFGLPSPAGDQFHVAAIRPGQANEVAWIDEKS